jgi:VIT1/CCC1 family predicted Fe2+/Mn2+ transporter
MEQHESSQSDQSYITRDIDLSHEVSIRSDKRRRADSVSLIFPATLAIISALFGAVPVFISVFSGQSSNIILPISAILGVVAIIIVGMTFWILYRRRTAKEVYTSEQDIRDDNLRELISEVAKSQIEFERKMTSMTRPSLPQS